MKARDRLTLILLIGMSFFLMCDLYITPGIVSVLAKEYGVPESSVGLVASAFTLIGAAISILFGYFTDKVSRKKLLVFLRSRKCKL